MKILIRIFKNKESTRNSIFFLKILFKDLIFWPQIVGLDYVVISNELEAKRIKDENNSVHYGIIVKLILPDLYG